MSLATGKMPMAGKPDQQIIMEKVQRGSYSAMMDGERPPFGLRELLRGLLSDNPDDRWGFEELEQWLGGDQRTTVKVSRGGVADRPYEFEGTGYKSCRLLAEAFGENLKKAEKQVYDPEFHSWLQRGFPDGTLAHAVGNALALGFDSARNDKSAARSVARVCMQLDRFGPIRFQGVAAMPTGLGAVFLDAELRGEEQTAGTVAAAISQGVVNDWFEAQSNSDRVIYDKEIKEFQQISQLLKHKGLGYGIERCLYMLNPSIPCLSPMLGDVIVGQVSELLPELERQIDHSGSFDALVDSHLAAFIASRIKGNIDRQLMFLEAADDDPLKVRQGMLAILAKVQDKHGPDELPALSQWFAAELDPLIDGFHAQSTREKLRRKVRALGAQGDLVALNECFDNEAGRKEDDQGRQRAAHEFAAASREISKLESREFQESAQRLGWKIAVGISNTILTATGAVLIFVSY